MREFSKFGHEESIDHDKHITNNTYKLIIALKKEEALSYNDYDRRIRALIEWYKNKEEKLICIGCSDDDIIELWYDYTATTNNTTNNNKNEKYNYCYYFISIFYLANE
ncbi:hypothetical protein H8356DRAFT_1426960 [Neocallimastix lanati (nom. inval.)]|nr:hypothetical protein H8356DRAFT_1426960 [Neocallimastix sp. JGI-2020a]